MTGKRSKQSKDPEVGICSPCLRPNWPEPNGQKMAGDEVRDVDEGPRLGHGEVALTLSELIKHCKFYTQNEMF